MAERLAALAEEGQIIASAAAASQFVPALDGDIEDMGDRHLAVHLGPLRVYSLMPYGAPDFASAPGRLVGGAADLRPTVAVLTPHYQGELTATAEVGDIVADQLIAALSRSPVLNVISRLTSHSLRHRPLSARQVGQLLSADFVVSGRSMRQGGRLRVNIEIADGRSGRVLGAHAAEDLDSAALHADSSLVQSLLGAITRAVFQQELQVARVTPLPNLATHTLLLAGIGLLYRLYRPDFERAHELLDQARRRAPHHAAPLVWLARWHLFKLVQGWSHDREQDGRLALDLARRALDLDPDSSLALTMLGNIHTMVLRDLPGAEKHLNMALAINPNESLAWLQLGNVRSFSGDGVTALAHSQRAARLSPLDPARHYYLSLLASAALSANELDTAINSARKSLRLNQSYISTHRVLTIALALAGRMEEAHAAMAQLRLLEPLLTVADFVARSPGARSGLAQTFGQALLAAGLPAGPR